MRLMFDCPQCLGGNVSRPVPSLSLTSGGGGVVGRGSSSKAQVASAGRPPLLMAAPCLLVSPVGVGASQVMAGGSGPVQVKDSPLLLQQIEAMQLSIKHLKNENNRLKVSSSR